MDSRERAALKALMQWLQRRMQTEGMVKLECAARRARFRYRELTSRARVGGVAIRRYRAETIERAAQDHQHQAGLTVRCGKAQARKLREEATGNGTIHEAAARDHGRSSAALEFRTKQKQRQGL